MSMSKHRAEVDAYKALAELLSAADRVKVAFEIAALPLPGFLLSVIGGDDDEGRLGEGNNFDLTPMDSPPRPIGVDTSSIWIPIENATLLTVGLGLMRSAEGPLNQSEIIKRMSALRPDSNSNGLYNAFAKLRNKLTDTGLGFRLPETNDAPVISAGYVWGPASTFSPFELADFRRLLILHLLKLVGGRGASTSELRDLIVKWPHQPLEGIHRDAVRGDVNALQAAGKIKRDDNTMRWTPTTETPA